jgi:hypothetical protein
MPKITYRPFDRLDPMLNEAPTRYSPRPLPKSERAQASSDHPIVPAAHGVRRDIEKKLSVNWEKIHQKKNNQR